MRTSGVAPRPAYRISRGMSGVLPVSCNISQISLGGQHVGPRAHDTAGFSAVRTGTTRVRCPSGTYGGPGAVDPTGDLNTKAELQVAASLGMDAIWGMSNSNAAETSFASDPTGWETYIRASLAQAIAIFGSNGVRYVEFRNEPALAQGGSTVEGQDVASVNAIVKSVLPNCTFSGPVQGGAGYGGTAARQASGSTSVADFLAGGGTQGDGINHHIYGGADQSPESSFAHQTLWLTETAKNFWSTANLRMRLSEWGYQTAAPGAAAYCSGGTAQQGRFWTRNYLITRAAECNEITNYYEESDGLNGQGLLNSSGGLKTNNATQMGIDAIAYIKSWVECSSYTRGINPLMTFTNNSQFYERIVTAPWYVRGTKADGTQQLAVWHPTVASFADRICVYNPTGVAQTLSTRLMGTSTTTQSIPPGLTGLPIVLSDLPQVLSGTSLRFPEFEH